MDRTLRVIVKTINELNNGTTREFPETKDEHDLIQFARAAKILNTLNKKGDLSLTTEDHTEKLSGPLNKEEIHSQDILAADKEGYHLKWAKVPGSFSMTICRSWKIFLARKVEISGGFVLPWNCVL